MPVAGARRSVAKRLASGAKSAFMETRLPGYYLPCHLIR